MRKLPLSIALAGALLAAAPAAASSPVVSAQLQPRAILFADTVRARIDVTVDSRLDDPASLRITTPLAGWAEQARTTESTTAGTLVRRGLELTIACRTSGCVPQGRSAAVQLPAATITVRRRDGRLTRLTVHWPPLIVASRLPADATTAAKPPFQLDVTPPPATPRLSASGSALVLDVVAALCFLGALSALGFELRGRRTVPSRSPLERALVLAREAESRPVADRRRALSLLTRVAPSPDERVAASAAKTAWQAGGPSPDEVEEIVRRIEAEAAAREPGTDA
jgi:hypothetical protein